MAKRRAFTVYYNDFSGELFDMDVAERFKGESALMQSDVLRDALHWINEAYNESVEKAFPLAVPLPDVPERKM